MAVLLAALSPILCSCIIILLILSRFLDGQERGKMLGAQGNSYAHDFSLGVGVIIIMILKLLIIFSRMLTKGGTTTK